MTPALLPADTLARRAELAADGALSIADAAAFLAVSVREVTRMVERGEVASAKLGRRRVVSRSSCRAFLAARMDVTE